MNANAVLAFFVDVAFNRKAQAEIDAVAAFVVIFDAKTRTDEGLVAESAFTPNAAHIPEAVNGVVLAFKGVTHFNGRAKAFFAVNKTFFITSDARDAAEVLTLGRR